MTREEKIKLSGFDELGFRPIGNYICLILSNDDLLALSSDNAIKPPKEKKSKIIAPNATKKLYKGKTEEQKDKDKEKDNRSFTVAALSIGLVDKEDMPKIGDEVGLTAGPMIEVKVNDVIYGLVQTHRLLTIHKEKLLPPDPTAKLDLDLPNGVTPPIVK